MPEPVTYTYKTAGDCEIKADVYQPATGSKPFPVVVHIHEGKSLGLVVESILDIVQGTIDSKRTSLNLLGTIITNNSVVDTINVKKIVRKYLHTT